VKQLGVSLGVDAYEQAAPKELGGELEEALEFGLVVSEAGAHERALG
jgi:hypothetical protein